MAASNSHSASSFLFIVSFAVLVIFTVSSSAQLSKNFYSKSCPQVFSIVQSVVHSAISKQPRQGASLLRLHFHDCFVNVNSLFLYLLGCPKASTCDKYNIVHMFI
ncbi:peroxidase 4 [Quercus suber]|uniref:peroxidase n=1 Tax=Quercus suber TaxID=58331 RepID=A0AAW0J7W6_QUESU